MTRKQSYKHDKYNRKTKPNYEAGKQRRNRKQEVQLWEFAVDQLHIIWDWTTSTSISASTGLGEFGVVPQLPTMYLASALREHLTSPATLGKGLRKL